MKIRREQVAWLNGTDPRPMLRILDVLKGSDRKLLLFGCACCRRTWKLVQDPRSKRGVEAVEAFVDGRSDQKTTGRAYLAALRAGEERKDYAHWACMFPAAEEYCNQLERSGYYQFLMTTYPFNSNDHHMVCAWHAAYMAVLAAFNVPSAAPDLVGAGDHPRRSSPASSHPSGPHFGIFFTAWPFNGCLRMTSRAQHPLTCSRGSRRCSNTAWVVHPASSRASANTANRPRSRSK